MSKNEIISKIEALNEWEALMEEAKAEAEALRDSIKAEMMAQDTEELIAGQYINLGEFYPTPGYTNEIIYLYGARDLIDAEQDLDDDEFLNVERIPLSKAVDMVLNNEIKDGKTQAAVLKLAALIERKAK